MPYELIVFPPDAVGTLTPDNQATISQHPATHSTGRPGIGFTIPDSTVQSNGCKIALTKPNKVNINQRAILFIKNDDDISKGYPWGPNQTAAIAVDDFQFEDATSTPPPDPPVPNEPDWHNPLEVITWVYEKDVYDLSTKEGCGLFTEECCRWLHDKNSPAWGHIKKNPGQNQYNGHAVDAIMLMVNAWSTGPGGYDIITESESSNAQPAFNYAGIADGALWYYPPAARMIAGAEVIPELGKK